MKPQKFEKERILENYLRHYNDYRVGIENCKKQLDYIMPSMTARYDQDSGGACFYISNNTEKVAIDRIESKKALDLHEEIEQYKIIIETIKKAFDGLNRQEKDFVEFRYFSCMSMDEVKQMMGYSEAKSVYRIRRHTLDKLLISLNNLIILK